MEVKDDKIKRIMVREKRRKKDEEKFIKERKVKEDVLGKGYGNNEFESEYKKMMLSDD